MSILNVHHKSTEYIKNNFTVTTLQEFYTRDFVNDARNQDFANMKSNPKISNYVKHVNILTEDKVKDLLPFVVKDFAFYTIDYDYVKYTQKITEKKFPLLLSFDNDYAVIQYNMADIDYYNSMINAIPGIFAKSQLIQEIFHTVDYELKNIEFVIDTATKQKRIITAMPSNISLLEKEYGISSNNNLSLPFRINRIIAKRYVLRHGNTFSGIKHTLKLFYLYYENVIFTNDKQNYKYIINFNGNRVDREYINYFLEFLYEIVPCWYEIEIIY